MEYLNLDIQSILTSDPDEDWTSQKWFTEAIEKINSLICINDCSERQVYIYF